MGDGMHVKLALLLVLVGLGVLFIIQNATVADVRFLFWTLSLSLSLLVFFLLTLGIIVGWLLHSYFLHRRNREKDRVPSV
jgi:uncharacterized integral membrane protein